MMMELAPPAKEIQARTQATYFAMCHYHCNTLSSSQTSLIAELAATQQHVRFAYSSHFAALALSLAYHTDVRFFPML
jgi:hypothetical protein